MEKLHFHNVSYKKESEKLLDRSNTFNNSIASLLILSFGKTDSNSYCKLPQNGQLKPCNHLEIYFFQFFLLVFV